MKTRAFPILLFVVASLSSACLAHASATDGTIDAVDHYAWSENAGWIDFGTAGGAVHVTDAALTGYAYGENIGWISLNCSNTSSCASNNYAVTNNAEGRLSGYAWSENAGWIDFAPTQGGVTISSSGVFSGYAYSENLGWIIFNVDYPVTTDWRPASVREVTPPATTTPPLPTPRISGFLIGENGPPVGLDPKEGTPGYKYPRSQIVYPDGHIVYMEGPTEPSFPWVPSISPPPQGSVPTHVAPPPTSARAVSQYLFTRDHRQGDVGEDILELQKYLNTRGFVIAASGPGSPDHEISLFGFGTVAALKKFQRSIGLPATGFFGPRTRSYINTSR